MSSFIQRRIKIFMLCAFVLLGLTGCSNPRGTDGKTKADQIIASEQMTVEKGKINVSDISDEKLKKEYEKLDDTDTITIEPTSFKEAISVSWFDGLIVWPIAQLINVFASWTDAGIGIILATLLIQILVFAFTHKSQMSTQRMQEAQPEIERIQSKYKGKDDERSRMMMAQEVQKIYTKYDIHPFGSILVTFIQLPIMMGMYYATMRAAAVVYGTFLGMSLSETPIAAFTSFGSSNVQWGPMVVYVLMVVFQIVSLQLPKWLKKYDDKKNNVKQKKYLKQESGGMASTMNTTMYFSTALIAVMYLNWPIAMSFYWLVSSVIRSIQQLILHFVIADKEKNKKK